MSLRPVLGDEALPPVQRAAGTYTSGPVANAGAATLALLAVHATAVSGTPTLNASLEESADGVSWTAVPGSSIAQLSGAGNAVAVAAITKNLVRVTSAVAGTTPSVTYRAALFILPS